MSEVLQYTLYAVILLDIPVGADHIAWSVLDKPITDDREKLRGISTSEK